ncbi:MAG: homocysteine S-methyltransferase family protein [Candidatus Tectomicrobia bacterium]|nr:homocysteine S-methyltransferase family protein [Candidatus Tectomicrobia bacterium]
MFALTFLRRLESDLLFLDGAMGSMLLSYGVHEGSCLEALNLTDPDLVRTIHRAYIDSGVDIIETNTFGGNKARLALYGLEGKVREINLRGIELAREAAANDNIFVAASIGPTGRFFREPLKEADFPETFEIFAEQISICLEGGIDLFVIETMIDVGEMRTAISAVRSLTDLPVVALMTYQDSECTALGVTPEGVTSTLEMLDIEVIGANCGADPAHLLGALRRMKKEGGKKLAFQPGAGIPSIQEGRAVYQVSPALLARYALQAVQEGVSLIGGCCGTTPDHMRAMIEAVRGRGRGSGVGGQ